MATFPSVEEAWGTPPHGALHNQAVARLWTAAPGEASDGPFAADGTLAYQSHPRGNPPLEQADLARGEETLDRVLGW